MRASSSSAFVGALLALASLASPALAQGDKNAPKSDQPKVGDADRVDKRPVEDLIKALTGTDAAEREVSERELVARKKASIAPLVASLDRATANDARAAYVRILRKIADPQPADALVRVYQDVSLPPEIRIDAALALGESKSLYAVPMLLEGLNDVSSLRVCESARSALEMMAKDAEDKIVSAWHSERARGKDARDNVLYRLILIMGKCGGAKARELLVSALKSNDPKDPRATAMRHHAAIALGETKDLQNVEPLIAALEAEHDLGVAKFIARSLEWITDQHNIPAQGGRWRNWWEQNKEKLVAPKDRYNPLPPKGLKPGEK